MQLSLQDEHYIQELVEEGNDAVVTRLVFELLNTEIPQERIPLLLHIGDRYVALALMKEDGPHETQVLEALLARRWEAVLSSPSPRGRDECAINWYKEAESNYAAALKLVQDFTLQDAFTAHRQQALVHLFLGAYKRAIKSCTHALSSTSTQEQQAEIAYLRGIVHVQQGKIGEAHQEFSTALSLVPQTQKYIEAQEHVTQAR